jgi:hypothetical protein
MGIFEGAAQLYCLLYHFGADVWTREASSWPVRGEIAERRAAAELTARLDSLDSQISYRKGPVPWVVSKHEGIRALPGTKYPVEYTHISDADTTGLTGYRTRRPS